MIIVVVVVVEVVIKEGMYLFSDLRLSINVNCVIAFWKYGIQSTNIMLWKNKLMVGLEMANWNSKLIDNENIISITNYNSNDGRSVKSSKEQPKSVWTKIILLLIGICLLFCDRYIGYTVCHVLANLILHLLTFWHCEAKSNNLQITKLYVYCFSS